MIARALFACVLTLSGCAADEAVEVTGYVPVSAVILRAEGALSGKTCGTGTEEVFKYRITVNEPSSMQGKTALYDCFVDAYLTPPATLEDVTVSVSVRGFSKAQQEAGETAAQTDRICEGIKRSGIQTVLSCRERK